VRTALDILAQAKEKNADFSFDSPAIYQIDHPDISYVLSYTHTYAGQALVGERIEARGMDEALGDIKRLVVGTNERTERGMDALADAA